MITDLFQCKLDLILFSLQLFRLTKKEFFLLFITDCLISLMVPKLGLFNEFEISMTFNFNEISMTSFNSEWSNLLLKQ